MFAAVSLNVIVMVQFLSRDKHARGVQHAGYFKHPIAVRFHEVRRPVMGKVHPQFPQTRVIRSVEARPPCQGHFIRFGIRDRRLSDHRPGQLAASLIIRFGHRANRWRYVGRVVVIDQPFSRRTRRNDRRIEHSTRLATHPGPARAVIQQDRTDQAPAYRFGNGNMARLM